MDISILRDIDGRYLLIDEDRDELLGNFPTEEEARLNRRWIREGASLGERLGFQPINSRTHGYNGQEHR